jgi:hypothetical protein
MIPRLADGRCLGMLGLWQELHRLTWRRLPRTFRRRLLRMITEALAPRPSWTPKTSDRFIVVGYLRACSGLRGDRRSELPMHGSRKELGTGLVHRILKDLGLK